MTTSNITNSTAAKLVEIRNFALFQNNHPEFSEKNTLRVGDKSVKADWTNVIKDASIRINAAKLQSKSGGAYFKVNAYDFENKVGVNGAFFPVEEKSNPNAPDYSGHFDWKDGEETHKVFLSLWVKTKKKDGTDTPTYLSVSVQAPKENGEAPPAPADDSDIPF